MTKKDLLLLIGIMLIFSACANAQPIKITFADGSPSKEITTTVIKGYEYIPLNEVATILNATKLWYPDTKKIVLQFNNRTLKFALDNPIVTIDGSQLQKMVFPVEIFDGIVYVPKEFIADILPLVINIQAVVPQRSDHIQVQTQTGEINITGIDFIETTGKTMAIISTTEKLRYEIDISQKGRLILSIYGGKLNAGTMSTDQKNGLFPSISAYQTDQVAQLSFALDTSVISTFAEDAENGIKITAESTTSYQDSNNYKIDGEFGVIVIDPGHGGRDPGAVGPSGVLEKDVTLAIAKKVKRIIENNLNIKVILTRYDDTFIGLRRRTEIANNAHADLFVSIHCNASPSRNARGSETYFLALAKTTEARAVEARENKVIEFEVPENGRTPSSVLELILWDMAQNEFHKESSQLAEKVQMALNNNLGIKSRGLSQAGFHVLKGAFMPAILVETAFLSNKKEEGLLSKDSFQEEVAQGIYRGIKNFINMHSNR